MQTNAPPRQSAADQAKPQAARRSAAERVRARPNPDALVARADLFLSEREAELLRASEQMFERYAQHRSRRLGPTRAGRQLSAQSLATYQDMWTPFATYCALQHIDPLSITEDELQRYLNSRKPRQAARQKTAKGAAGVAHIGARHGFRILSLIDKVLRLHAKEQGREPNPAPANLLARPPFATINAPDKAGTPLVLSSRQIEALKQVCTLRLHDGPLAPKTWSEVRDNAAVLLQLATGIAPLELRRLQLQHVLLDERDRPERLALQATDTYGPRQVPIAFAEAARLLDYWLEVRDAAGVQGDYVFPSKASGTQWSEESLLKKTRAVMTRAGLGHLAGGGYRLRHTYILRRLKVAKLPPETVAELAGIREVKEMVARYSGIPID
jgi:site-specific recombinase XerD